MCWFNYRCVGIDEYLLSASCTAQPKRERETNAKLGGNRAAMKAKKEERVEDDNETVEVRRGQAG